MTENLPTDQTHVILLTNGVRIWITEAEFKLIQQLSSSGKTMIDLDTMGFNINSISYFGPRAQLDEVDRRRKGEWQCEACKRWHPREEQCGCQGGKY